VPSAARSGRGGSKFVGGIHEGGRHAALISHLGRYHDGTRTLGDLIEEAHRFNADCVPPEDARRVERDARSVYGMAPCRRRRHADPRAEAVLEAWSDHFYDERLPRGGRSKTFDVANYLLISAGKSGEFYEGEEGTGVVFSDSIRGIESKARTTKTSVGRATQLMREEGFLKMLKRGCGDQASTWLLIVPPRARTSGTFLNDLPSPLVGQGQKGGRAGGNVPLVRGDRLRTLFWRWGSLIGTGGRVVLVALEAFGPQTAEELAELVGISRTRDLVSRRLVSLEELGLIERDGERWRLAEGHMEAQSRLEGEEYATGGERKERRHTNEGRTPRGRRVTSVGDTSYYASELKRDRDTRERQKKERAEYQKMLREIEEAQRANEERRSMLRRMRLAETVRLLSDGAIVEADGHIGELRKAPQP
jgi:DNA-binding transcriptional regulator GbsR (MarR family)